MGEESDYVLEFHVTKIEVMNTALSLTG